MLYNKDWDKTVSPVAKILLAAADHIEQHGWLQHEVGQQGMPACAIGAMMFADNEYGGDGDFYESVKAVTKYLGLEHAYIVPWNNTPGRTKEEVIAAFRGAAAVVKNESA